MMIHEAFGLNYDPFAPGAPAVVAEPVKAALAQITGQFEHGVRAVVITGAPGTGKTLLLTLIQDSYKGRNLSVSRVDLAALFPFALDNTDLLLLDEADSADPLSLQAWLSRHSEMPRTIVLACRPDAAARLCEALGAVAIHLSPLSVSQAKHFMSERVAKAGRADLFAPGALDDLVEASAGLPQALRSLSGMAMFLAAYSQAREIDVSHVEEAIRSQGGFLAAHVAASGEPKSVDTNSISLVEDAAPEEPVLEEPPREVPALTSCLADALVGLRPQTKFAEIRPEPRVWFRRFSTGRELAGAALLVLAIAIPQSAFFGTQTDRTARVALASMTPRPANRVPPDSTTDSLRRLDRVAKAVMPGRVVLAIVPQGSLQPIAMPPLETGALPPVQLERRTFAALPSAALGAIPPPSVASVAGAQAVFGSAPARSTSLAPPLLPPKYLTANAISLALLDTAEMAGLQHDDEFAEFRACVFRRVSPGGAEQRAFWRAVSICIRV